MKQAAPSSRAVLWLATLAALVAIPAAAAAQEPSPASAEGGLEAAAVVLELHLRSQEGGQTAQYRDLLSQELLKQGKFALMGKDDAMRRVSSVMVMPTKRVTDERLQEIEKKVTRGDKLLYTDPREAVDVLHEAKKELVDIMETISLNARLRDELFKTQMLLARSHLDNGNEKRVRDVLREVVLQFGDAVEVTDENYHPSLVALFKEVRDSMAGERTAALHVESEPPGAEVLLNSQPQTARTPFTYEGLYPGSYNVLVRKDQMESMVRRIELAPNGKESIEVDVGYEYALDAGKGLGLRFDDVTHMDAHLADYAARLGSFLGLDAVILVGVVDRGAGPQLAAFHVDVKSRRLVASRELVVKAAVVSARRAEQMAAFLSGQQEAPEGVTGEVGQPAGVSPWYENAAGWALTGVGVAGLVVGAIFTADWASQKDKIEGGPSSGFGLAEAEDAQSSGETSGIVGAVGLGVGGAALVTGVVLFVLDAGDDQPETQATPVVSGAPVPLPGGGGVTFGLTF